MKHLLLIRHAKSGWDNANLQDFDRPLSDRGKKDAILMENFLNKIEYMPHLILCSPARRTQQTYDILFGVSEIKSTLYPDDLYHAGDEELLNIIKLTDEDKKILVIIGHNPSLHNLLEQMTNKKFTNFPTSGIACLQMDLEWEKVANTEAKLIFFKKPKDFQPC